MLLQILQKFSYTIHALYHFPHACKTIFSIRFQIFKLQIFLDVNNCINPESCDSFIKPPVYHLIQFF